MQMKELKELVGFMVQFGNGLGDSLADGKLTIKDLPNFLPAARMLLPAVQGIENVFDEVKALTDEEIQELVAYVVAEFNIPNQKAEELVEDSIGLGLRIFKFVNTHFIAKE